MDYRSPTPWLLGGVLVLAGVGAVHVLTSGSAACKPTVKAGDRVLLIGDSLAVGLSTPLRAIAAKTACEFKVLAESGTRMAQWLAGARRSTLEGALASFQPTLVLVSLGTNDSAGTTSDAALAEHVAQLAGWLGQAAKVLWILPPKLPFADRVGPAVSKQGIPAFDSSALPLPQADGIHPTGKGYAGWAEHLWATLTCSPAPAQGFAGVSGSRPPQLPMFLQPARLVLPGSPAARVKVLRKAAGKRTRKKRGWRV